MEVAIAQEALLLQMEHAIPGIGGGILLAEAEEELRRNVSRRAAL